MNNVFTIDREFLFKSNIYEITSISIEQNHDINASTIEGEFIISGTYRLHEISINKEDFCYKIPFKHELRSNIKLDTISLDINDFNYNFVKPDELDVHIEYLLTAEESIKEFDNMDDLDNFLSDKTKTVEIIDFREKIDNLTKELDEIEEIEEVEEVREIVELEQSKPLEKPKEETHNINQNMIIDSINTEDEYVLYHIHTVTLNDTIESITKKYNISINKLKEYNTFENLELNMKILIPNEEL